MLARANAHVDGLADRLAQPALDARAQERVDDERRALVKRTRSE
jgi:hypothetical protein